MESARKCPTCGLDLTGIEGAFCPFCAARIAPQVKRRIWLGALVQFVVTASFILLFRLPKFLIVFFGVFGCIAVLLASGLTRKAASASSGTRGAVPDSAAFKTISFAIALCSFVLLCFLLFGFVVFINSWNSFSRYEGQPFHRAEFIVVQDYYQSYSKHVDLYARGTVAGRQEWMDLVPYLRAQNLYRPQGAGELMLWVPAGTSIPIYLFPNLKGRSRVRLYSDTPPAEAYRQAAMKSLHYGLGGMAICALAIFLLIKIRASWLQQPEPVASLGMPI